MCQFFKRGFGKELDELHWGRWVAHTSVLQVPVQRRTQEYKHSTISFTPPGILGVRLRNVRPVLHAMSHTVSLGVPATGAWMCVAHCPALCAVLVEEVCLICMSPAAQHTNSYAL